MSQKKKRASEHTRFRTHSERAPDNSIVVKWWLGPGIRKKEKKELTAKKGKWMIRLRKKSGERKDPLHLSPQREITFCRSKGKGRRSAVLGMGKSLASIEVRHHSGGGKKTMEFPRAAREGRLKYVMKRVLNNLFGNNVTVSPHRGCWQHGNLRGAGLGRSTRSLKGDGDQSLGGLGMESQKGRNSQKKGREGIQSTSSANDQMEYSDGD